MQNNILKDILKEYEQKRIKSEKDLEIRKNDLYYKNPRLLEIEEKLNALYIEKSKNIIFNTQDEALENKINNLINEKNNIFEKLNIKKDFLLPKYECYMCNDTGYITNSDGTSSMCSCLKQKIIDINYNKSNIGNLEKENFDNFNLELYSDEINTEKYNSKISPRENVKRIKESAINFINNFDNIDEKNILFTGNTGLGKTFLSNCIAKEILKNKKTVLYQTSSNMIDNIISYRFGNNELKGYYEDLLNVDLLIIDDLGTESINNMKLSELFNIINTRILNQKNKTCKTIISTNLSLQNILNTYDERIFSRFVGYYNIYKFFGDDIRLKK